MKHALNAFFQHSIGLILFFLVSIIFFQPVLEGKTIFQSDIVQYKGGNTEKVEII